MSPSSMRRSNSTNNNLLKVVTICITINVIIQISLHLHLDNHLSFTTSILLDINSSKQQQGQLNINTNQKATSQTKSVHNQPGITYFSFSKSQAEEALKTHGRDIIFQPLRAYIEKRLNDTVPIATDIANLEDKRLYKEFDRPLRWYVPLPLREGTPDDLRMFEYGHKLKSCNDLPAKLPIDRGFGEHATTNVNNKLTYASGQLDKWEEAKEGCPVNADPFLPWLHDMFPDKDGKVIHFIAQNRRRCNSGKQHIADAFELQPQVTIMQPVSVQRVDEATAQKLAPELWSDGNASTRYRLAPHEESDADGMFTRFICRFRAMDYSQSPPALVNLGETLSTYPYNYEFVNYRKEIYRNKIYDLSMLTPTGNDNSMFWLAQSRFDCPVPGNGDLRLAIASGESVLSDGTPSIYVDVVPIRTAPRYGKAMSYFTPDLAGETLDEFSDTLSFNDLMQTDVLDTHDVRGGDRADNHPERKMKNGFDPWLFWGKRHVLPRIEASGRYENLPICRHPGIGYSSPHDEPPKEQLVTEKEVPKKHKLIACLWAAATFTTRGNAESVTNTLSRIIEWIEFHLMVGFDHIYVYDNTGAHTDEVDLESTLYPRFLESEVTYINWPSRVCNNNSPNNENKPELSSQYAAENSCRARYGPYTEWMASFDTDEYLIPMGDYNSMVDVVDDAKEKGTQILTFKSTRALPIASYMEPFHEHSLCGDKSNPSCLKVKDDSMFAEVYNCDFEKSPKPEWATRAKKQLYRPEYVMAHCVHYATVTQGLLKTKSEAQKANQAWSSSFHESKQADQFTDENNQAVMLHSKTTVPEYTADWKEKCKLGAKKNCHVGFPWPGNTDTAGFEKVNKDDMAYNCFINNKSNDVWIPKLRNAMKKRQDQFVSLSAEAFKMKKIKKKHPTYK